MGQAVHILLSALVHLEAMVLLVLLKWVEELVCFIPATEQDEVAEYVSSGALVERTRQQIQQMCNRSNLCTLKN
jgi:hypothetical protein